MSVDFIHVSAITSVISNAVTAASFIAVIVIHKTNISTLVLSYFMPHKAFLSLRCAHGQANGVELAIFDDRFDRSQPGLNSAVADPTGYLIIKCVAA